MTQHTVLLYELNEVSWQVIDRYLARSTTSVLAEILKESATFTTIANDPNPLEPWRTWPILHTGLDSEQHKSLDLGQDPSSFGGEPLWETAAAQGKKVGVFGALQSWPARHYESGGFYVPDTFSRSAECVPARLSAAQAINLRLTQDNTFSADAPLPKKALLTAPLTFLRAGVRPSTALRLAKQVLSEIFDRRAQSGRSILQALPMFDIFMRELQTNEPDLAIFFTNHVAGMMHRFWADGMAEFGDASPYPPDSSHAQLIWKAMRVFEQQLATVVEWSQAESDRVVIVASSMGQASIPYEHVDHCYVVSDSQRLLEFAGAAPGRLGLAMYPAYSFEFESGEAARDALQRLAALQVDGVALFEQLRVAGNSLHADIVPLRSTSRHEHAVIDNTGGDRHSPMQAGITVRRRLGGGNTAHHIPQGTLFMFGAGVVADDRRREIDLRSVKDLVLSQVGCSAAARAS